MDARASAPRPPSRRSSDAQASRSSVSAARGPRRRRRRCGSAPRLAAPYRGFSDAEVFVELPPGTGVAGDRQTGWRTPASCPTRGRFGWPRSVAQPIGDCRPASTASPPRRRRAKWRGALGPATCFTRLLITFPEGADDPGDGDDLRAERPRHGREFERRGDRRRARRGVRSRRRTLEGYLFPSTYALPRHAGADGAVRAMVARFDRRVRRANCAPTRQIRATGGARRRDARVDRREGNRPARRAPARLGRLPQPAARSACRCSAIRP